MATIITIADVRARGAEFAAVLDATIQLYINDVEILINFEYLGERAVPAGAFLVCHYLKMDGLGTTGIGVMPGASSIKVGQQSITFTAPTTKMSFMYNSLMKTGYGQRYLDLTSMSGMMVL
jgi:hypothetical protein